MQNKTWLIFIILPLIAIGFVWNKTKNDNQPYYLLTQKIYCHAEFYDHLQSLTTSWTKSSSQNSLTSSIRKNDLEKISFIKSNSYRNEDIYVFEIQFALTDSSISKNITKACLDAIENDQYFKSHFFSQSDIIDRLTKRIANADTTLLNSAEKIQISINYLNLIKNKEDLNRKLVLPSEDLASIQYIIPNHRKSYLIAIIFSIALGILIQFTIKKKNLTA